MKSFLSLFILGISLSAAAQVVHGEGASSAVALPQGETFVTVKGLSAKVIFDSLTHAHEYKKGEHAGEMGTSSTIRESSQISCMRIDKKFPGTDEGDYYLCDFQVDRAGSVSNGSRK